MAIKFISQNKRKISILIFGIIILLVFFIIWLWFLEFKPLENQEQQWEEEIRKAELLFPEFKKIEINFEILKHPIFQVLEDLPEIILPEKIGREHPFSPLY